MNDRIWPSMVAILIGVFIFVFGMLGIINHLSFPGEIARIEQARSAVLYVNPTSNEDVMGKVVDINMEIATNQVYGKKWWSGWAIPDGWADVELIDIPTTNGG